MTHGGAHPFDVARTERLLAPFARDPERLTVVLEDADGRLIAAGSPARPLGPSPFRRVREIRVGGAIVGRLIAMGPAAAESDVAAAIDAVAIGLEQIVEVERDAVTDATRSAPTAPVVRPGLEAELAQGRLQQRSIVSLRAPDIPGYDLASHYEAARELGGDFFELFRLRRRGHPLGLVIADVTGKGIGAAMLMAFARPVMHSALGAAKGPADALERTNRVLVEEHRTALFITALCATLDLPTGHIRMANAGHEPPLLVPAGRGSISPLVGGGVLLGAFASLDIPETETDLAPGDILVLYTDGVTDAVAPSGERFGDSRLFATIEATRGGSSHDVVAAIRDAVAAFRQHVEPADDVTIVAVGRHRAT